MKSFKEALKVIQETPIDLRNEGLQVVIYAIINGKDKKFSVSLNPTDNGSKIIDAIKRQFPGVKFANPANAAKKISDLVKDGNQIEFDVKGEVGSNQVLQER